MKPSEAAEALKELRDHMSASPSRYLEALSLAISALEEEKRMKPSEAETHASCPRETAWVDDINDRAYEISLECGCECSDHNIRTDYDITCWGGWVYERTGREIQIPGTGKSNIKYYCPSCGAEHKPIGRRLKPPEVPND